jgi:hypothetical protein
MSRPRESRATIVQTGLTLLLALASLPPSDERQSMLNDFEGGCA